MESQCNAADSICRERALARYNARWNPTRASSAAIYSFCRTRNARLAVNETSGTPLDSSANASDDKRVLDTNDTRETGAGQLANRPNEAIVAAET